MEQLDRRIRFVLEDLHQAMVLRTDDDSFVLAVIDAYRALYSLQKSISYNRRR